jgi:hypothetical protein
MTHFPLLAVDLEIYLLIKSLEDCKYLQTDINVLQKRCFENYTDLNFQESNVVSSSRKSNIVIFKNHIGDILVFRTDCAYDIYVILYSELYFHKYFNYISSQ